MTRFLACLMIWGLFAPALAQAAPRSSRRKVVTSERPGVLRAGELRTETRAEPLGISTATPRLSWTARAATENRSTRGEVQTGYQVLAASTPEQLTKDEGDLWDSGKVSGADVFEARWAGKPLRARQRVHWKVRVWDRNDLTSPWSQPSWFEVALLGPDDWKAAWIEDATNRPRSDAELWQLQPAPLFRKAFQARRKVTQARAYVTGLGYYELYINGKRVGDQLLDPGWTNYAKRVLYATHDVTSLLAEGENVVAMLVGNGWWNLLPLPMFKHFQFRKVLPVGAPRAILQLELTHDDGSTSRVTTDGTWKVTDSGFLRNDVYVGELFDARKHPSGWERPGFDDSKWRAVRVAKEPVGRLEAQELPPIKVSRRLRPVRVTEPRPGLFVFDMGQNFAGRVVLRARGPAGTRINLRYAEVLYPDGTPNGMTSIAGQIKTWSDADREATPLDATTPPKTVWQQDAFVLAGTGADEIYAPRFTFRGFRYVAVDGYPGRPTLDVVEGQRLGSAVESVGSFTCSNPLYNQLQDAVRWTLLSNVFSVQSDCPHREKLGYGGDIVAASEMAILNFDMAQFYAKAARDFADGVRPGGGLPETAPFVGIDTQGLGDGAGPMGWAIAHPVLLRDLLRYYGNRALVEEQYPVVVRWLEFLRKKIPDHVTDRDISDHEALTKPLPRALTGTAFYHQAALLAAELAQTLGREADRRKYTELAQSIAAAFDRKFRTSGGGKYGGGTQTEQAFALFHGLVPVNERSAALSALVEDIEKREVHLSTGIFATKYVLDLLPAMGRGELAARLVAQRTFPSWGYMLDNGATTLWEAWRKDERVMSHNHPMFGSVSEWMFKHVGGIAPAPEAIGFDRAVLRPRPSKEVTWAKARHRSPRGELVSEWSHDGGTFVWEVVVPVGVVAQAWVPTAKETDVSESGSPAVKAPGVKFVKMEGGAAQFELRAGRYRFTTRTAARPR